MLVVKPARVGGPGAVAEIGVVAAAHGVPVVVSSLFESGIGIAAAIACAATLPDVPGGRRRIARTASRRQACWSTTSWPAPWCSKAE